MIVDLLKSFLWLKNDTSCSETNFSNSSRKLSSPPFSQLHCTTVSMGLPFFLSSEKKNKTHYKYSFILVTTNKYNTRTTL